jgi:hypothetical protein
MSFNEWICLYFKSEKVKFELKCEQFTIITEKRGGMWMSNIPSITKKKTTE